MSDKPEKTERQKKVDELFAVLTRLWGGGGDYGVYAKAIEAVKLERLLHELLDDRPN